MNISDEDIQMMDTHLDGQLPEADAIAFRSRLESDPSLTQSFAEVQQDRLVRASVFRALEPSDAQLDALVTKLRNGTTGAGKSESKSQSLFRIGIRRIAAAAACVLVGVFAAQWYHRSNPVGKTTLTNKTDVAAAQSYRVALVDEAGRESAAQDFSSKEMADEFAKDLKQWQERQRKAHDGAIMLISDRF